jgi:gliding motility-associated protein GldM
MSGGKETPRQKMIGMMYLVLTALLALNVSKAVLDAFVAIEDNMQKAAITQFGRGNGFIADLKAAQVDAKSDTSQAAKVVKIDYYFKMIDKIDKETASMIKLIDGIKVEIMKESGEDVENIKPDDHDVIMWVKYDEKGDPLRPARMNLMAVSAKDQYDVPMHSIIGEDVKNPTGSGKDLWEKLNKYRANVCSMLATYDIGEGAQKKSYSYKPKAINTFKDQADLTAQVRKMMKGAKINENEDQEVLEQLYMELTKQEKSEVHGISDVHWIGKTFDHAPLVAALASLTNMQVEILSARATAVGHLKSKVSSGEYSFNKVTALATGESVVNTNGDISLKVMMAAYDSDNQPIVTCNNSGATVAKARDGYAMVTMKAGSGGPVTLTGTVAIIKKSGATKKEKWTKDVIVMTPTGTVSLPEMNVLYRGYPNIIEGVASGYATTSLSGSGVSLSKKGKQWVGKPGTGRSCKISVSGKTGDGASANLGTFEFRVSNLPPPALYLGTVATGSSVSLQTAKSMTKLFAKYPPEIPLKATFAVSRYEVTVSGAPRSVTGQGSKLSAAAKSLIKQAKKGSKISISGKYKGMGYSGNMATIITVK